MRKLRARGIMRAPRQRCSRRTRRRWRTCTRCKTAAAPGRDTSASPACGERVSGRGWLWAHCDRVPRILRGHGAMRREHQRLRVTTRSSQSSTHRSCTRARRRCAPDRSRRSTWCLRILPHAFSTRRTKHAEFNVATCAHLEIAVGVEQQVGWLQVAVQHVGRVNVLQAAQQLPHDTARQSGQ